MTCHLALGKHFKNGLLLDRWFRTIIIITIIDSLPSYDNIIIPYHFRSGYLYRIWSAVTFRLPGSW